MAKKYSSSQQRRVQKGKSKRKRGWRVALVLLEMVMILILSVGCYAVNVLGKIKGKGFSSDSLYVYNGASSSYDITIEAMTDPNGNKETEQATEGQPETEETTAEQKETGAWAVAANMSEPEEIIEEEDDFLAQKVSSNGYWNILVLGVDARKNEPLSSGDYRADVIMICSINAATKEIKLASIYRDTVMYQPSTQSYIKINDGVFKDKGGGIGEMISAINLNLDMNIEDAVVVNWAALALVVNALGGLELEISEEEVAKGIITGYLTEVVEETDIPTNGQFTHGGLQLCDGPKVVAYCRNRYTTGSDFNRTGRQREVIEKLLAKARTADLGQLIQVISIVSGNIYTTLSVEEMMSLARDINSYTIGETTGFPDKKESTITYLGSWSSNYNIIDPVVPLDLTSNVRLLHSFLFGADGYQPSSQVQTISENIRIISGY